MIEDKQINTDTDLDRLAREDWRMQPCASVAEARIVMPDRDRRGCWIEPIAEIPTGCTETVIDDGTGPDVLSTYETTLINNIEGRNLYAIAAIPQMARLITWAMNEMCKLNPIHFDSQNESGRFMRELRNRMNWIRESIEKRDRTLDDGTHKLMTFDEAVDPHRRHD